MDPLLEQAMSDYGTEVDAVAAALIVRGTPPIEAILRARDIVERRRRCEASGLSFAPAASHD